MQRFGRRTPKKSVTTPNVTSGSASTMVSAALAERWSRPSMFVLAAVGATIGFNNFWQFPYLVDQYGGGAFILVYLLFLIFLGAPLLMAEVLLGRRGRGSPIAAFRRLTHDTRTGRVWAIVPALAIVGSFLIFSYLTVIAGWALAYFVRSGLGVFTGLTADGFGSVFTAMVQDPEKQLFWHGLFLFATLLIVARGVRSGLEQTIKILVPLLFGLLLVLVIYSSTTQAYDTATAHVFAADFSKLSFIGFVAALGHVFFSLGLGVGTMMMYGAYLEGGPSIARLSLTVVLLDVIAAIAGAIIVYSVLYSGNVESASGPALVFQALPLAFDHLPFGRVFATVFFALLVTIALLTSIALAEPAVVWLGERFGLTRARAAITTGIVAWILGLVSILSFNHWAFTFRFFGAEKKLGAFDVLQTLTAQGLLPLTGVLVAVFVGWVLRYEIIRTDLALRTPGILGVWYWLVRIVIPVCLLVLFFNLSTLYK